MERFGQQQQLVAASIGPAGLSPGSTLEKIVIQSAVNSDWVSMTIHYWSCKFKLTSVASLHEGKNFFFPWISSTCQSIYWPNAALPALFRLIKSCCLFFVCFWQKKSTHSSIFIHISTGINVSKIELLICGWVKRYGATQHFNSTFRGRSSVALLSHNTLKLSANLGLSFFAQC